MEMMEKEKIEQQSQARKPFQKPSLRIYGRISAITQLGGNGQAEDNPNKALMNRTGA
jgi:hypothetical protein